MKPKCLCVCARLGCGLEKKIEDLSKSIKQDKEIGEGLKDKEINYPRNNSRKFPRMMDRSFQAKRVH